MTIFKKRSVSSFILSTSYSFTESFIRSIAIAGCIGNVFFFFYLHFSGYSESPVLRLIAFTFFASYPFIFKSGINGFVKKAYYEITLCFSVPFLFNYLFLLNTDRPFWGMTMPLGGFIYGMLSRFYIIPFGSLIGWLSATTVSLFINKHLNHSLWENHESFVLCIFASLVSNILVVALINTYKRMTDLKVEQERLIKTEKNYNKLVETEKLLRESEEKFRLIIENSSEGIFVIQNNLIRYANPKFVEISGYTFEELYMKPFIQFLPADERVTAIARQSKSLYGRSKTKKQISKLLTKKGYTRWVEIDSIEGSWNNKAASISFIDDITERIESEQELKRYRHKLEELVKERTKELEKAYQELVVVKDKAEAATRSKSEFLANMSHEIRTPMNAIVGVCDLIRNTALTVKQREYMNIIRSSSRALLSLINDILDFSKIEAGKLEFEEIPFVLSEVTDEVSDMLRDKIQEKDLEFIIDIEENVPQRIISDPLRLKQILVNLTSNAIKFTNKGEVCISVTCKEKRKDRAVIQFIIRDTGAGIPDNLLNKEGLEKLFDSFFQADSSSSRRYGGSGLGLSITKNIVEMMDGEISVTSMLGKGSVFTVTAEFKYLTGEVSIKSMVPNALKTIRALIIDDNSATLAVIKRFMNSFGFEADRSTSARDAILKYRQSLKDKKPYKLVIIDIKMPGMDGITVAEKLKTEDSSHLPTMVFISTSDYDNSTHRFGKKTIENFLTKPVKQSVLFDTIMNAFGYRAEKIAQNVIYSAQTQHLAGAKILLVEDNPINQMVAIEILSSADMIIHKAGNGQEAIEILKEIEFDAVLMDIQMPGMDGIKATEIIRNELKLNSLPIIAMTANAMSGDREKCLNAGMNDYISKPIESRQIFSVLSRWISDDHIKSTEINNTSTTDQPEISLSFSNGIPRSLPGLNVQSGLSRINENISLYCTLLNDFMSENTNSMVNIRKALSHGNTDYAKLLIHTIKGVSGNIGAIKVFQTAKNLETTLQEGKPAEKLLAQLEDDFKEVVESIAFVKAVVNSYDNIEKKQFDQKNTLDEKELFPMLNTLKRMLENNEFEAESHFKSIIEQLAHDIYIDYSQLASHINNLEFNLALNELSIIMDSLNMSKST